MNASDRIKIKQIRALIVRARLFYDDQETPLPDGVEEIDLLGLALDSALQACADALKQKEKAE